MLGELHIKNFAVIKDMAISFCARFECDQW